MNIEQKKFKKTIKKRKIRKAWKKRIETLKILTKQRRNAVSVGESTAEIDKKAKGLVDYFSKKNKSTKKDKDTGRREYYL